MDKKKIWVIDDNERFLSACKRRLAASGFCEVTCLSHGEDAIRQIAMTQPDLLMIDIHLDKPHDGLDLLKQMRRNGYQGLAMVISGDASKEQCFRAAASGADDFILKRPHVNLAFEVRRVFQSQGGKRRGLDAKALSDIGYLRSFGLTEREIEVLALLTSDYCTLKELAERAGKEEGQIRKLFSKIYKKLGVENFGRLIHVLTACSMFSSTTQ